MKRILAIALVLAATVTIAVLGTGASSDSGGGYKVRAVFDNGFALVNGLDVKTAGVKIGKVEKLEVTRDNKAAAVMSITDKNFHDFRSDAKCTIRPQSLIGERFIECSLTEPRAEAESAPPALREIPEGEEGAGQFLLPVERTSKSVDTDLINNVFRLPQRQRLAILLNELGAGLGGRAEDLNETVRRANPALQSTNEVLKILAQQNQVLARLATDSDRVLAPLARDREAVADFIVQANTVSRATAERRGDLERNFELLPRFLEELRPTMVRLGQLSDQMSPVLEDLGAVAPDVNRFFEELGPFSQAGIPALKSLGEAAEVGRPALVRSKPIIDDIRRLTDEARPLARNLSKFAVSLRDSGGIERLMDYLFYQVAAINGFDSLGHYLRAGLIVNTCTEYAIDPAPGCSSKFSDGEGDDSNADDARAANDPANIRKAFAARAGEDHSAQALRGDKQAATTGSSPGTGSGGNAGARRSQPLRMPRAVLPGQDPTDDGKTSPAEQQIAAAQQNGAPAAQQSAQDGLLDYLMGDG